MPAIITEVIPEQGFEKVRDAIGVILLTELSNQKTLQGFDEDIVVYRERIIPTQTEENLYFNILLDSANYGNYTKVDAQGRTLFFIDIYTTGKNTSSQVGSLDSGVRLGKFLGMVRYILSSPKYLMLGLPYGLIGGTYVESFVTSEPTAFESATYSRFGRISFSVRIQENQTGWDGVNLAGNDTAVRLDQTDFGFVYTFNN